MSEEIEHLVGKGLVRVVSEVSVPRGRYGPCLQNLRIEGPDGIVVEKDHSWVQYNQNPDIRESSVYWERGQQVELECEIGQYQRHDGSVSYNIVGGVPI